MSAMHLRRLSLFAAMLLGTTAGCASMTGHSKKDLDKAYASSDEAKLFDMCQKGMKGSLNGGGARGKLDEEACDRYGAVQLRKLADAVAKGDAAFVKDTCDQKSSIDTHPKSGSRLTRNYNAARYRDEVPEVLRPVVEHDCRNLGDNCSVSISSVACAATDLTAASTRETDMEAAVTSCAPETVDAAFTKAFGDTYGSNPKQQEWFVKAGVALMKCGEAPKTWVFEHWLHWGSGYGESLADALAPAGIDLETQILAHLDGNAAPFGFKNADFAAGEAARWMRRNKRFSACKPLIAAYPKMAVGAQFNWLWYFGDAKCAEAKPFAEANLGHQNPDARMQACKVLGSVGDKASVKKMTSLAQTDPFWKWVENVKVYPVRDDCTQAINAIQSR